MRTLALTMATLLVGHAGAKSLTVAMAQIKKNAGFDPKEPPQHKTDVKVGMYIEHLLEVSATASALPHTKDPPDTLSTLPTLNTLVHLRPPHLSMYRTQVSIEEHTFDMDFYFTLEWQDQRNYRRDITRSDLSQPWPHPQSLCPKPSPKPKPKPTSPASPRWNLSLLYSPPCSILAARSSPILT